MEEQNTQNSNETNQPSQPVQPQTPSNPPNQQEDLQKKNKQLYYIIGGLAVLLLAGLVYFFVSKKDSKKPEVVNAGVKMPADSAKVDSARTTAGSPEGYEGEEGEYEPYTENYVIAKDANLRDAPNAQTSNIAGNLKFGQKLFVDNQYENPSFAKVYMEKPVKNVVSQPYYMLKSNVVEYYNFDDFKQAFSLGKFSELEARVKRLILDNKYNDGTTYSVTQNADRAKNTVSYGDFDGDGQADVAVILDNNEKQSSRLLIICTNQNSKEPYLAYAENYSDKMRLSSFKKKALIYMNTDNLTPSPIDGVLLNSENAKLVILYDKNNQKYRTYYQEEYASATAEAAYDSAD
ncbi:hypothetical protein SAMN05660477_00155 [Soonwooa buanensis]|uniref:Repeat domain-containing protein n=1 Tax=Soonwooa buanensis TaxID=619805 RepID=A0A1T5CL78_9FLAO|nr:hypothetical protein [Soonwooa buanensis]SKB60265.1 hypothetical protein SAMN05660477_00155 [Soonwooa buanensis]